VNPLLRALTESVAHGILTVELALGVAAGLVFVALYSRTNWWHSQAGRLAMGNMAALTLIGAAGLLYRLGWQSEALTLLLPTCAAVLAVQVWWVRQLLASSREPSGDELARMVLEDWHDKAMELQARGRSAEAQLTHAHILSVAAMLDIPVTEEGRPV
jgi:hypothetical protein